MSFWNKPYVAVGGVLLIIVLAIWLPYILWPRSQLLDKFALSQLAFSAVAFFAIFLTLYINLVLFPKYLARPKIRVFFSENRATETSVRISKFQDLPNISLELWVTNDGNAVAKVFQLELDVPDSFNPNFDPVYSGIKITPPKFSRGQNIRTISFCNIENYCFVGLPVHLISLVLERHPKSYSYDEFKVPYRIFGDWAETQEGELKIICKKT